MDADVQTGLAAAWALVPDGSTLNMSTRSVTGNDDFAGSARITSATGVSRLCKDADIHDGPCSQILKTNDDRYDGEIAVAFDSAIENQVAIDAWIINPAGLPHGIPYHEVVSGSHGDVETRNLFIGMREG